MHAFSFVNLRAKTKLFCTLYACKKKSLQFRGGEISLADAQKNDRRQPGFKISSFHRIFNGAGRFRVFILVLVNPAYCDRTSFKNYRNTAECRPQVAASLPQYRISHEISLTVPISGLV